MTDSIDTARTLLKQRSTDLLKCANVVATGVGYKVSGNKRTDTPSIICSVEKKVSASQLSAKDLIPAEIDHVPTDVVETGTIRALQEPCGADPEKPSFPSASLLLGRTAA